MPLMTIVTMDGDDLVDLCTTKARIESSIFVLILRQTNIMVRVGAEVSFTMAITGD
jgi:hypothetical protein